jgi:DNA-binding beta-propeller fold protein YncE
MSRFVLLLVVLSLVSVRSATAADVDIAPVVHTFGSRSTNPLGAFTLTIGNAVHDATGDLYVVESLRVQKFDREGVFIRAWTCFNCSGIDVNQVTGDVYVTAYDVHQVRQFTSDGALVRQWGTFGSGPGQLTNPHGIGVDPVSGEVYVFDTGNARVQVFSGTGVYLRQFGQFGTGEAEFSGVPSPSGIAFDAVNDVVYVTEPRRYHVKKFAADGTFIQKWGDPVGITPGHFRWPRSVELDGEGRVYITDTDSERIQYFTPEGLYLGQFQGPNNVIDGAFHPRDIAINRLTGEKYVNASYAFRQDKFDEDNTFVKSWGVRDLIGPRMEAPMGMAVSPTTGDVYVFDAGNFLLKRFSAGGAFIQQWGGSNRIDVSQPGLFGQGVQSAVATTPDGQVWIGIDSLYYATDPPGPWLQLFEPNSALVKHYTRKPFCCTYNEQVKDLAVEPISGDLFVADAILNRLRRLDATGAEVAVTLVGEAAGLAFANGKLFAVDPLLNVIRRWTPSLVFEATIGGPGNGDGQFAFNFTSGVAVDAGGRIFVADTFNHRIQQLDANGAFVAKRGGNVAGSAVGQFNHPMDVALSPTGDLLYVVDTYNHRIQTLCVGLPETCQSQLDDDGDTRLDSIDNCPFVANTDQSDTGGVGSATPDAVGDACQCGDVTDDNRVTSADVAAIRTQLAQPGSLESTARCSVAGNADCAIEDVSVLVRRLAGLKPALQNLCSAAGTSGP